MGIFDGVLICTDLDGTLLKNDYTVSKENLDAIEYFKKEGGLFTVVTGRMPHFAVDICEKVRPNAPIGCINGGGLYDFYKKEYVWTCGLDKEVNELIRLIDENFSDVGIQVNTFYQTFFCKDNGAMQAFIKATNAPRISCRYDDVKEPVAKIIFTSDFDEEIEEVKKALLSHPLSKKYKFIRSEKTLYEILPKESGKGTSISKLCEHLKLDKEKTIALGDYDNDVSMFYEAKLGVAVSNASPAALEAADVVTVSNEENAIAKVICDLENGKLPL